MTLGHRRRRFRLLVGLIAGLSLVPTVDARAQSFSPAGCRIEYVDNPHLTNSPGVLSVKANSKIQCDAPVRDLVLTVRLYEKDKQRQKTTTEDSHKAYLYNQDTYVPCETDEPTEWHAKGWGVSVEGDTAYFSDPRGTRGNTAVVDCGTK